MLHSSYIALCAVRLPYAGRQRYMHSFDVSSPKMAEGFEDYLEPVEQLLRAANCGSGIAHMTVDEKIVPAGMSQRRPGPHVDGCFIPKEGRWGGHPSPGWNHYCNNLSVARMPIIVVSSTPGCKVWAGHFEGEPLNDGNLSHIKGQLNEGYVLPAHVGFLLSPDCVHESLRFDQPTRRTFLRIALPVEFW